MAATALLLTGVAVAKPRASRGPDHVVPATVKLRPAKPLLGADAAFPGDGAAAAIPANATTTATGPTAETRRAGPMCCTRRTDPGRQRTPPGLGAHQHRRILLIAHPTAAKSTPPAQPKEERRTHAEDYGADRSVTDRPPGRGWDARLTLPCSTQALSESLWRPTEPLAWLPTLFRFGARLKMKAEVP